MDAAAVLGGAVVVRRLMRAPKRIDPKVGAPADQPQADLLASPLATDSRAYIEKICEGEGKGKLESVGPYRKGCSPKYRGAAEKREEREPLSMREAPASADRKKPSSG